MAMVVEVLNYEKRSWELFGYIGEPSTEVGKKLGNVPILGDDAWLLSQDFEADLVIGIGQPNLRARVLAPYLEQGDRFRYPNLIHPTALVDLSCVKLGRGNVITAGCIFTCDIEIRDFNLFNLNTTIGHDVRVGNYNVFNPGVNVSGGAHVGDCVLIGTGCQILENLEIGNSAVLGAGAVITKDVLDGYTVVGVPAKPLKMRE